jgi:hypothetical protein
MRERFVEPNDRRDVRRLEPARQIRDLDLPRYSGEGLGHSAAIFSNCTGLVKSRAEWRRTGL